MKDYSQLGEQAVVLDRFANRREPGRWLEIGAYDGVAFSNTRALLDLGWSGVALEPSSVASRLRRNLADFDVEVVEKGLWLYDGTLAFHDDGGNAVASASRDHVATWQQGGVTFRKTEIDVLCWDSIFDMYGENFDMISLDTEGTNLALFAALPFERLPRTSLIVVEHDGFADTMLALAGAGWRVALENELNLILERQR